MNLEKYDCFKNPTHTSYSFQSVGPNGTITKIVSYQPIHGFVWAGKQVVNLGFGDWNVEKQTVDDSSISNNLDKNKVLATVAWTILSYCSVHGNLPIFAQGSTPARTRLYQMGLNANLSEVENLFIIYGVFNDVWRRFEPVQNYEAFLIVKK
ncbi:hypothetical protein DVR12_11610 [Chitinophaga silvatica]|uniref:Uncharacterized protein n=1 Tax=Chitinophaga silvatica TaxID=2282649 RepID=A0A3E1Y9V4_9BACT|nr:hypothetical protein [Chitinophaga silvatica]RFS22448.1 hypothetical protein DVR12_11610 [Chitinophaga silvatica]